VQLRLLPSRALFRVGPAWAVLAGALAAGLPQPGVEALLTLVTAAALADLVWGALREIVPDPLAARAGVTAPTAPVPLALPYLQPDAPLARWLRGLTPGATGAHAERGWQGVLIALVVALVFSLLLGVPAALTTALALFAILVAAATARRGDVPAFLNALLDVGLPWALGSGLVLWGGEQPRAVIAASAGLAAAFTVLQWGVYRAAAGRKGAAVAWLGQALVLLTLIGLRQPWAVAGVAALFAPASCWLARGDASTARALPWWWAAMLLGALSLYLGFSA
jgi:hypothetical protein